MQKVLILTLLVVCCIPLLLAKRDHQHSKNNHPEHKNCTIIGYGPCTFKGDATCGAGRKEIKYADDMCVNIKTKPMRCKISCARRGVSSPAGEHKVSHKNEENHGCQYQSPKKSSSVSPCDPETKQQSITLELTRGNPQQCPRTKVIYKKCKSRSARAANGNGNRKRGRTTTPASAEPAAEQCKYRKGPKTECDANGTRTVTRQLKRSSPSTCPPTKIETKTCRPKNPRPSRPARPTRPARIPKSDHEE